jgi:hypothetical protein
MYSSSEETHGRNGKKKKNEQGSSHVIFDSFVPIFVPY